MISAIILAAGESKRMSFCKQLIKINGRTMIAHIVESVCASRVDETIVVLGFMADEIAKKLPKGEVKIVVNPNFREGISTSLKAGLEAVDKRAEAAIFILSDQPFLEPWVIDIIIDEYKKLDAPIVVPVFRGRRGNPVLFDMSLKEEIMNIRGDIGGRSIMRGRERDVVEVEIDSPIILMDIDTEKDLEMLKRRWQG